MKELLNPAYTPATMIDVAYSISPTIHDTLLRNWISSGREVRQICGEVSIIYCDPTAWWMLVRVPPLQKDLCYLIYRGPLQKFEDGLDVMWLGEDEVGQAYVSTLPPEYFNPHAEEQIGVVSENIELFHLTVG